ncbi:MAG: hypothetical protein JXR07_05025 [Reichenbachiella sp.]
MRNLISLIFIIHFGVLDIFSQNIEEEVYLHVNSTNLISGETLLFSAYVNSKKTNKPSPLSSILYVELINEEGKIAFQSKLSIENGRGYGDLFISSTFRTGVYQLIAYTRWMKNFKRVFEVPITIINPFEKITPPTFANSEWEMKFFTSKNGIILNQENTVDFHVTNNLGHGAKFKGKIVDQNGEGLLDIAPIDDGFGSFQFTPKSPSNYQAILEDENGQFHFFNLPKVEKEGSGILFSETNVAFELKIISTNPNFEGTLLFRDKNSEINNETVVRGSSLMIPKSTLRPGIYHVSLESSETILDERLVFLPFNTKANEKKNNQAYKSRSLVSHSEELPPGSYSISVRRVRDRLPNYRTNAENYTSLFSSIPAYYNLPISVQEFSSINPKALNIVLNMNKHISSRKRPSDIKFLPDYRGELLDGTIQDSDSKPLTGISVMYSSLGENHASIATSNNQGGFTINVPSFNEEKVSFVSLLDTGAYTINIENNFLIEHPQYNPPNLEIDSLLLLDLVKSSVHTQVENAYFEVKKDSLFNAVKPIEIFSEYDAFYLLDDYNRFPTLKETFIEYIPFVAVKQKRGIPILETRSGEYTPHFNEPTLILLDGVPVDTKSLYTFSPYKVKSIGVISKRYYLGPKIYDGVISLKTFEGNLHDFKINENILKFNYQGVQPKKIFKQPDYSTSKLDRIPDRREQLLWIPETVDDKGILEVEFYTSDIQGKYVIHIEGYSVEGKPYSSERFFEVKY